MRNTVDMSATPVRYSAGPEVYATVVAPDSDEYEELQRFQAESFARVQAARDRATPSYVEATHTAPSRVIPIAVRRASGGSGPGALMGMSRLELPGATLIESMIQLREDSVSARALASAQAAEISSFAVAEGVARAQVVNVVDAVVGVIVQLARAYALEWLWVFPRAGFMSIIRAEIPETLPPYHFTLSPDIAGWIEQSSQLATFRAMRLKGFLGEPFFYQIRAETLAADLDARTRRYDERAQLGAVIEPRLKRAMFSAERTLRQEIAVFYPVAYTRAMAVERAAGPVGMGSAEPRDSGERGAHTESEASFLPEGLNAEMPLARYLRQVLSGGGASARAYKELSYSLLNLEPGMRVLDVGCGAGVDLPALSGQVGPLGATVGLEFNQDLVREARKVAANHNDPTSSPIFVLHGDAHNMTIPTAEFERVRTDRALQHFSQPATAVHEMWRVLKPGGILTLVEPDWGSMVVAPGSLDGQTDATVSKVFAWCQRHLANPFIGRRLNQLLRETPTGSWASVRVVVAPFMLARWEELDSVLLLERAAMALKLERPELADELTEWLDVVQRASDAGTFFGYVPIYYGVAVKSTSKRTAGG
ncbi:MAG TPA: methyltransferase domain-containing protein [Ktedonobacterales bacterium]|nr:methyltransferase domain-containing protein [Ktedonobacterales bacterium]